MVRGWRKLACIYTRTTPRTAPFRPLLQLGFLQVLSSTSISRLIWAPGNPNKRIEELEEDVLCLGER